jgi:two-component system chemotaxis response regulator CheB
MTSADGAARPSMNVFASAGADYVADSHRLAQDIVAAVTGALRFRLKEPDAMPTDRLDLEAWQSWKQLAQLEDMDEIGERSPLTCLECGGKMWRMRDGSPLRYRCHAGHAFSALCSASPRKFRADHPWYPQAALSVVRGRYTRASMWRPCCVQP